MSKLRLTFACWSYDRTRGLIDGSGQPDGIDLLAVDWFARAADPLTDVQAEYGFTGPGAKSLEAKVAGSAGPFQPGGITPDQLGWGQDMAVAEGRPYESHGAALSEEEIPPVEG